MYESNANDDNVSIRSDDSNISKSALKEKLEDLIQMELKHSGVYYDLNSKNTLLKVDLENLNNSCQRFENQKKKKSELLEERYDKLIEYQNRNKSQLKEKLSLILQKLEETNSLFYKAFDDYRPEVLKNSINHFDEKTIDLEKNLTKISEELNTLRIKGKIEECLMKSKPIHKSDIEIMKNMLFELTMKRPEITLEDIASKKRNEIKKLEQKLQSLKSTMKNHIK